MRHANPHPAPPPVRRRRFLRLFPLWTAVCLVGCVSASRDRAVDTLYRQGNAFYEQGQYGEASRTYERILQNGFQNGYVYYNLGNAYFKQNKLGLAILAYERARRLMPRDPDIRANLEIARLRMVDKIPAPEPWFGQAAIQTIYRNVTMNEALAVTSGLIGAWTATIIMIILSDRPRRRRLCRRVCIGLSALLLIWGVLAAFKVYDHIDRDEAIMIVPQFEVRSGPGTNYEPLFALHEGTKVTILEQRGQWMRITLPDGKTGWVEEKALGVI